MRSTIKHWAFAIAFAFALPYAPPVSAAELAGPQRALISSTPAWVKPGAAVDLDFASNRYWLKGASGPLVVSRASAKTCADLSGNYIQVSSNVLCRTNAGASVEEARTNFVLQNQFQGLTTGAVGSGGSLGTGWLISFPAGVTVTIAGSGVESGLFYADIAVSGAASASGQNIAIARTSLTEAPVYYGQTYTQSMAVKLQTGALTGLAGAGIRYNIYNSSSVYLTGANNSAYPQAVSLGNAISAYSFTILNLDGAYINGQYILFTAQSVPLNFTMRIAAPQTELNPLIPASVASAVTAASGSGGVNGTAVYSVTGGTCTTQPQLNVTWTAGVLTVNSVANAGSCSVLPPSPATLAYASGTATGWTGATVTLTPVDNSAKGSATTPILTSSGAATRAAENDYYPLNPIAGPVGLYAIATPEASASEALTRYVVSAWNNASNFTSLARYGGAPYAQEAISGTVTNVTPAGTWAQNTSGKLAGYFSNNSITALFNNGAVSSGSPTGLASGLNGLYIGSAGNGTGYCNCTIARVALAPSSLNGY